MQSDFHHLEQSLGYSFSDRELPVQALTHPSFVNERDQGGGSYQRLEFLGDAILGLALAEYLFHRFPDRDEGTLSRFRSQMADQSTLAALARERGIGRYILLGKGEEQTLGRSKESILADVMEALIAAVYLDGGIDEARRLVLRLYGGILERGDAAFRVNDAKSELQELLSSRKLPAPCYRLAGESGPPHQRIFRFEVVVGDNIFGEGEGSSKKIAQQAAATRALERLSELPVP